MTNTIPDFSEHGILPPGTYLPSLAEIEERFGGPNNPQRAAITVNLMGFLNFLKDFAVQAFIDGSYTTTNPHPGDVDVLVILPESFDWESRKGLELLSYQSNKASNLLDIHPFKQKSRVGKLHEMLNGWTHTNDIARRQKGILLVEFGND